MIIVLKKDVSEPQIQHILNRVKDWGFHINLSRGKERTVIGIIGDEGALRSKPLDTFPGVESVLPVLKPYKLASREFQPERSIITIPAVHQGGKPLEIGGAGVVVVAGPCSVEGYDKLLNIAHRVKKAGAHLLRAGVFKPRTSPYSFQGLGVRGLDYLARVRLETGLPVITEVMDTRDLEMVEEFADIIQIGARNMQNFHLLKAAGRCKKPILLKRGLANTIEEWLMSAEYVMSEGNHQVILCERGIRTFEKMTRNTTDISAVPVVKRESHLPVMVDPSHGTGQWYLVNPVALAAVAAGADGIMVEVHDQPEEAWSDGGQSLLPEKFDRLVQDLGKVAVAIGRGLAG